jgi:hypothetical protein
MTTIFWILLTVSIIMYLEGLIIASFVGAMSQPSKWAWPLLLIFWPIALPILAYKTYAKYRPIIQQVQENPLLGSLLGFNTPQANPLMELFNQTSASPAEVDNPFANIVGDIFTEENPSGEQAADTEENGDQVQ